MTEQWLTSDEAAKILNCSARHVRRLCRDGSLVWERQGSKQLLIDAESVQSLKEKQIEIPQDFEEDVEEIPEIPEEPVEEIDSPIEEAVMSDSEELRLQDAMGSLDKKLKKRLGDENRYVSDVQQTLRKLNNRYTAERDRNRRVQATLQKLLAELQVPFPEKNIPLWRRIFRHK